MTSHAITWLPSRFAVQADRPAPVNMGAQERRRVVLVDLYWTRDKDPRIPLGHASLLAVLNRDPQIEAISVVAPVNRNLTVERIANDILRHTAGLSNEAVDIAIGAYIWNEPLLRRLLPRLRKRFGGRIILGGPQVTYVASGLEGLYPAADVFIRGFAETSLAAVARNYSSASIPGVHYAGTPDAGTQSSAALDTLPSPILDDLLGMEGKNFLRWETRRGCQFKCSFCQHRQPEARSPRATYPLNRIMREIDLICRIGVSEVAVLDPVFNSNEDPGHAERVLLRFVANGYRGRLALQCRAELITDTFLDAAQKLDVCLEFGLQTIHQSEQLAVERTNNMQKIDHVLGEVRRRGIDHEVSLIFGLPQQTLKSFYQSVQWCLERSVPVVKAFPLLLLRGTKLELERARWNLVVDDETMPEVISSDTFSRQDRLIMLAISQQLSDTERDHPRIEKLIASASMAVVDPDRFQPALAEEMA